MDARLKSIEADRYNVIRQIEKQLSLDDQIKKISNEVNGLQRNTRAAIEELESYLSNKEKYTTSKPAPPRNLRANAVDHCSITLTWENCCYVVDGESSIVEYEVLYSVQQDPLAPDGGIIPLPARRKRSISSTNCSEWSSANSTPKGSFVLEDLNPETLYTDIKIRCRNKAGWWSEFCSPIGSITTRGAPVPPNSPQNFVSVVLSKCRARLEWAEPFSNNGKKVVGYDLIYHEKTRRKEEVVPPADHDDISCSHHQQSDHENSNMIQIIKHHIRLPANETSFNLYDLKDEDTEYINISLASVGADGLLSDRIPCDDVRNAMSMIENYNGGGVSRTDNDKSLTLVDTETPELSRREANFHFRINSLISDMNKCNSTIEENVEYRAKSIPKMMREQDIIAGMKNELKRISDVTDEFVHSSALHGTEQKFCTQELRRILQDKVQISTFVIEKLKAENISREHVNRSLRKTIEQKDRLLQDRKTALMLFVKQVKSAASIRLQLPGTLGEISRKTFSAWKSCVRRNKEIGAALQAVEFWKDKKSLNNCIFHWREITKYYSRTEQGVKGESLIVSKGGALLVRSEISRLEIRNKIIQEIINISKKSLTSIEDKEFLEDHLLACCEETFPLIRGNYHCHLEEYSEALACYLDAMELIMNYDLNASDKMILRCNLLNKIGRSAVAANEINRALVAFDELQNIAKKLRHGNFLFLANLGLGECYVKTQEWDLAETYAKYCSNGVAAGVSQLQRYDESIKLLLKACHVHDANHSSRRFLSTKYCSISKQIADSVEKVQDLHIRIKNNSVYYGYGIQFKRVTSKYVKLKLKEQNLKTDLALTMEKLEANTRHSEHLSQLITNINHELQIEDIRQRVGSEGSRRISCLVHDNIQSVDAHELTKRLKIRLEESGVGLRDAIRTHKEIEITISNLKDELENVEKEHELEKCELVTKNILKHRIRLMAFNNLGSYYTREEDHDVSKLVVITVGKDIFIHDSLTGDPIQVFEGDTLYGESSEMNGHSSIITSVFFQGKNVFSGAMDKKLCAWDVVSGKLLYVANGHDSTITCIVACDGTRIGDTIISGSVDKTLIVWRKYDGVQLHRLTGHSRGIFSLDEAFCTIVSGDADGDIFLWDTEQVSHPTTTCSANN